MTFQRTLSIFALAATLALASPAAAEILIGAAGPFSGTNAALGEQLRRGVQQAVDDINATGGLRGERLAVKFADDGCDPRKAVEVATQFVSDGVAFVAGHYCSGSSIPASKVYEAAGIVQISPASTHPKYTDGGGWNVIRICPRDDAQGSVAALRVLTEFAGRKVAILNDQSPAAIALTDQFRTTLKGGGVAPAIDESYRPGAKDYGDLALRLRNAGIDVIFIGGSYVESGQIIRQLRDLGSAAQLISNDALVTPDFWKAAREAGEGTLMTFTYDPQKFDAARSAIERFREQDYTPEGYTLYAYAAVQAWVQAAEATGGTDSHRIAAWLRGGNRVRTVTGEISFDSKGDLRQPAFSWLRWRDGNYVEELPANSPGTGNQPQQP